MPAKLSMLRSKGAHAIGAEIPAIEHHRHPHGHDDPRRAAGEQAARKALLPVFHGKARPENVLEEGFQQCRHGAVPERKQKHPVLRPSHVVARIHQCRWQLALLEIGLRAQQGKFEIGDLDAPDLVVGQHRALGIGVGHRIQEMMTGRIGMALDDGNALVHRGLSTRYACQQNNMARPHARCATSIRADA